jgi:6-pyruvoyl-tetrahydropterin synthase
MMKYVYCRTRFIGFHCWPGAPEEVWYLRAAHRHEFHVEVAVKVEHDDRDVEFQTLRKDVDAIIELAKLGHPQTPEEYKMSCEMFADVIYNKLKFLSYNVHYVDVSEDGENGARIVY